MKYVLLLIILVVSISCSNPKKNENKRSTQNEIENNIENSEQVKDSIEKQIEANYKIQQPDNSEQIETCSCKDYHFSSSENDPVLEHEIGDFKFIVCGYSGGKYNQKIALGKVENDSSTFLSGFNIFECKKIKTTIFENGEFHLDKVKLHKDYIQVSRYINLPVESNWQFKYVPVFSINIYPHDNSVKLDTAFVLDISNITESDIESFKTKLLIEQSDTNKYSPFKYPEEKIYASFIRAVIEFPDYNDEFKNIDKVGGAYVRPLYRNVLEYFEMFEKEKFKSR